MKCNVIIYWYYESTCTVIIVLNYKYEQWTTVQFRADISYDGGRRRFEDDRGEEVTVAMCLTVLAGGMFARSKRTKPVIIFGVDSLSTHHWLTTGVRYRQRRSKGRYVCTSLKGETDLGNRQILTRTWLEVNVDCALRIKITYARMSHLVSRILTCD